MSLEIEVTSNPTDWVPGDQLGCIAKSRFGEIILINLTENGNTHSRPLFIDRGGTITIIVDKEGNVVLESVSRPVCKIGERIQLPILDPQKALGSLESLEPEFPRGYSRQLENAVETGIREAGEETGLQATDVIRTVHLGETFLNGFNPQPNDHVAIVVNRQAALKVPEMARLKEVIERVEWVSESRIDELIAEGQMRDVQSLAIWSKYRAAKRMHPELFE